MVLILSRRYSAFISHKTQSRVRDNNDAHIKNTNYMGDSTNVPPRNFPFRIFLELFRTDHLLLLVNIICRTLYPGTLIKDKQAINLIPVGVPHNSNALVY